MSRHDFDLDGIILLRRAEQPRRRWSTQKQLFHRFGLGGGVALLLSRIAFAASAPPRSMRMKVAAVGLLGVALVGSSRIDRAHGPPSDADKATLPDVAANESSSIKSIPSNAEPTAPTLSVDALPTVPPPVGVSLPSPSKAHGRQTDEDDLAKEAASLAAIRSKLGAHDYAGALASVHVHRAAFPRGLLKQEASVLEIEARQGLGQTDRACSLGHAFLETHATSAHRTRVLALLRSCSP